MRKRRFAFWPTPVRTTRYWQDGFRWFKWVWLDSDGNYYTTKEPL